ncbi:MAG: DNA/RNA non-specific endonuclease [Lachnospiraceae bacterium]|nr:DNA/RNA non-specific endonuclease [Lachnospiraceae bacterium]
MKKNNKKLLIVLGVVVLLIIIAVIASKKPVYAPNSATTTPELTVITGTQPPSSTPSVTTSPGVPVTDADLMRASAYAGEPFVILNDNRPYFKKDELTTVPFENYGQLDYLDRCTACVACLCYDTMPTEKRESISSIKPTGWHSVTYDIISTKNLYNRAHLIGYQLGGNAGDLQESQKEGYDKTTWKRNLITGTRYLNVEGMLPFENMVADYIKEFRDKHVMYRVTPVFVGNNLLAEGVVMEGYSVEDNGEGIEFCVFCYNVQPGIEIDYRDGSSKLAGTTAYTSEVQRYILNVSSKKIHLPGCDALNNTKEANKKEYVGHIEDLIAEGYQRCGACNP